MPDLSSAFFNVRLHTLMQHVASTVFECVNSPSGQGPYFGGYKTGVTCAQLCTCNMPTGTDDTIENTKNVRF